MPGHREDDVLRGYLAWCAFPWLWMFSSTWAPKNIGNPVQKKNMVFLHLWKPCPMWLDLHNGLVSTLPKHSELPRRWFQLFRWPARFLGGQLGQGRFLAKAVLGCTILNGELVLLINMSKPTTLYRRNPGRAIPFLFGFGKHCWHS